LAADFRIGCSKRARASKSAVAERILDAVEGLRDGN